MGGKRRGMWRHNNMSIYPSEPSLPPDHTAAAPLSQFPSRPQVQEHNHLWDLPFLPAWAQTWGMKDDVQKGSRGEKKWQLWFWCGLWHLCYLSAAAKVQLLQWLSESAFLIRLYLTFCQGHAGLGTGGFVRCSIRLIMINTHLLNTWATQGQARGLLWLPLFHTVRVASCFKKQSCIVLFTFLNSCVAAPSPSSYLCLPLWKENREPVLYRSYRNGIIGFSSDIWSHPNHRIKDK